MSKPKPKAIRTVRMAAIKSMIKKSYEAQHSHLRVTNVSFVIQWRDGGRAETPVEYVVTEVLVTTVSR